MTGEQWRPVPGFPSYSVSDRGRVRSSHIWRGQRDRVLIGGLTVKGYPYVQLVAPDGSKRARAVHGLVSAAFLGPRPPGQEVRHLDGDSTNNCLENLAYGSHGENERDKVRHGTHNHGSRTECIHGHPFNEANTRPRPNGAGRRCAICRRESARRQRVRAALRSAGVAA